MKRTSRLLLLVLLLLSFAVVITNCGGGGSSDSGPPEDTAITSDSQGAKAAVAGSSAAASLVGGSFALSGMGMMSAPQVTIPESDSRIANSFARLAAKFGPKVKKARALKARATNVTTDCTDGGNWTYYIDDTGTSVSMTFNDCQEFGEITDGVISFSCTDNMCESASVSVGSSGRPFVSTTYTDTTYTTKDYEGRAVFTISMDVVYSPDYSDYTATMTGNGYLEEEEFNANTTLDPSMKGRIDMDDFEVTEDASYDSATMAYVYTIDANGSLTGTYSENSGSGYAVEFTEQIAYYGMRVVWKDLIADGKYAFSIDGTVSVSFSPGDVCFEGTFTFVTNEEVVYDYLNGVFESGQITVNGNTVIVYNADGSVTVTVDGTPADYTEVEYEGLCPDLEIESAM